MSVNVIVVTFVLSFVDRMSDKPNVELPTNRDYREAFCFQLDNAGRQEILEQARTRLNEFSLELEDSKLRVVPLGKNLVAVVNVLDAVDDIFGAPKKSEGTSLEDIAKQNLKLARVFAAIYKAYRQLRQQEQAKQQAQAQALSERLGVGHDEALDWLRRQK